MYGLNQTKTESQGKVLRVRSGLSPDLITYAAERCRSEVASTRQEYFLHRQFLLYLVTVIRRGSGGLLLIARLPCSQGGPCCWLTACCARLAYGRTTLVGHARAASLRRFQAASDALDFAGSFVAAGGV